MLSPYFCTPLNARLNNGQELPDSIMVVRQFLVLFVLVRIQVGQQLIFRSSDSIDFQGFFIFRAFAGNTKKSM